LGVKENPMNDSRFWSSRFHVLISAVAFVSLALVLWWFLTERATWSRAEAFGVALGSLIKKTNTDESLVAQAIFNNYIETRIIAARWSAVYWGFTFVAASLSALAGLILKFESIVKEQAVKKDIAALFSVVAAIMITVSTSGDFQRKWQANRIAAAELERIGYELLAKNGSDSRPYLSSVAQILHARNVAIAGSMDERKTREAPSAAAPSE
jgi:predicted metal-binding membrane protein